MVSGRESLQLLQQKKNINYEYSNIKEEYLV